MSILRFWGFLTIVLAMAGCSQQNPQALRLSGVITLSDAFVFDMDLVDDQGQSATDERFRGKTLLVYYGFASCPDVCPAALSVMSASLEKLGKDNKNVQALFITVDPERDTPAAMRAHLAFDDRILGLTGTLAQANAARSGMKVYAEKVPLPDSALEYTMDHQSLFYVIDKNGSAIVALEDSMAPADIAAVVREIAQK